MSTEVKKSRGRPRKAQAPEEPPKQVTEQTPALGFEASTRKMAAAKVGTSTTARSDDIEIVKATKGRKKSSEVKTITTKEKSPVKRASRVKSEETPSPPPAVARLLAIEESKILEEVSKVQAKRSTTKNPRLRKEEKADLPEVAPAEVLPPLKQQSAATAAHLQPANTLAMGLPIPTYQSTTQTIGLHAPHCLPWLPNPPTLTQAAYLSTTTPVHAGAKRKLPSLKEANRFAVTGESSRGGPGSGAAHSRSAEAAENARGRPELLQPGEMPAKYKPALRRVQAIIVALPIVIVTSYMLYERLVLGKEQKKVPRLSDLSPGASSASPEKSSSESSST